MSTTGMVTNRDELLRILENNEVSHALQTTLEKLPKLVEQYDAIEKTMNLFQEITKYRSSIVELAGEFGSMGVSRVPEITIGDETIGAVATLVNKLPKLAEYLTMMDEIMNLTQSVLFDKRMTEFIFKGVKDMTEPVQEKIKDGLSIMDETKKRACADQSTMSIFSVLKLLKDPSVQDGLKFTKAFLSVVSERRQDNKC